MVVERKPLERNMAGACQWKEKGEGTGEDKESLKHNTHRKDPVAHAH